MKSHKHFLEVFDREVDWPAASRFLPIISISTDQYNMLGDLFSPPECL